MNSKTPTTRCAIYTRKSSEEGLEQEFNTLDAQRQAGANYVKAKSAAGWQLLPDQFDDGGYSGGNTDRPGLRALLDAVRARRVDVVVIYRLDRLTRSIKDFGELFEVLSDHGVSLASVCESLDTSTAPGRLMVHLLLSFAQYERELASERTRDKIAASRRRGLWTGGRPVLGYDFHQSRLTVNDAEAATVRQIFARYLELRSIAALVNELGATGVVNKAWNTRAGRAMGGCRFVKSTAHQLLTNVLYIGRVPHHKATHPGQHPGIVDPEVFARVQSLLTENGRSGPSVVRNRHGGLLKGLLECGGCGAPMVHTSTKSKGGGVHRYYACRSRRGATAQRCRGRLVPAGQIEDFVVRRLREPVAAMGIATLVQDIVRERAESELRDLEAILALRRQDAASGEPHVARSAASEVARLERQVRETREAMPTATQVRDAVQDFDGLWTPLSPTERSQVLAALVSKVTFDAAAGQIAITTRPLDAGAEPGASA